jgi:hypothetical protein
MKQPLRILLQTTIAPTENDWSIARFSLLDRYLSSLKDESGNPLCDVVSRVGVASPLENRQEDADGNDPVLSTLDRTNIEFLPAHPHEGAVGVPTNSHARVIATGKSVVTDRQFNLIVAFVGVAYRR